MLPDPALRVARLEWPIKNRLDRIQDGLAQLKAKFAVENPDQAKALSDLRDRADRVTELGNRGDDPAKFNDEKQQIDAAVDAMLNSVTADLQKRDANLAWAGTAKKTPCPVRDLTLTTDWQTMRDRILQSNQPADVQQTGFTRFKQVLRPDRIKIRAWVECDLVENIGGSTLDRLD